MTPDQARATLPADHPFLHKTNLTPKPAAANLSHEQAIPSTLAVSHQPCAADTTLAEGRNKSALSDTTAATDMAASASAAAAASNVSVANPSSAGTGDDQSLMAAAGMVTRLMKASAHFISGTTQQASAVEPTCQVNKPEVDICPQLKSGARLAEPDQPEDEISLQGGGLLQEDAGLSTTLVDQQQQDQQLPLTKGGCKADSSLEADVQMAPETLGTAASTDAFGSGRLVSFSSAWPPLCAVDILTLKFIHKYAFDSCVFRLVT